MANWEKVVLGKGTSSQYIKGDGTFATYSSGVGLGDTNTWTSTNTFSSTFNLGATGNTGSINFKRSSDGATVNTIGGWAPFTISSSGGSNPQIKLSSNTVYATGHTGIGKDPATDWKTNVIGLQVGAGGTIFARSDANETKIFLAENVKWTSSGFVYITGSKASAYHGLDGGIHTFAVADNSGSANAVASFTTGLTINNDATSTFGNDVNIASSKNINFSPPVYTSAVQGIKFDQDGGTTDAIIQPVRLSGNSGVIIYLGSNSFVNTSGGVDRYNDSNASSAIEVRPEGQIRFLTNSSSADPLSRMSINSNGNIGIGTDNPDSLLSVYSTTTPELGIYYDSSGHADARNWMFRTNHNVYGTFRLSYSDDVGGDAGDNDALTITKEGNATFGGELDVNPATNKRIKFTFPTDEYANESRIGFSDLNAHITYKAQNNFMEIWSYNSLFLQTGSSPTTALTLGSDQSATFAGTINTTVNTTGVIGDLKNSHASGYGLKIQATDANASRYIATFNDKDDNVKAKITGSGHIEARSLYTTEHLEVRKDTGAIYLANTGNSKYHRIHRNASQQLIFDAYDGSSTITNLTFNSDGKAIFSGAVTINASNNSAYTSDNLSRYIELDASVSGGGGIVWKKQSSNISRAIVANQGAMYFARSTADDNSAAPTYDMFIKNTGEVGIGTVLPADTLHLEDANNTKIRFSYSNGEYLNKIANEWSAGTSSLNMMRFYISDGSTTGNNEVLRLSGNKNTAFFGNVGINDSTPPSKLTVTADLGDGLRIQRSSFESTHYTLFDADSLNIYPSATTNVFYINNDVASNVALVTGGGNVGIGTGSPAQALDVAGSIISTGVVLAPTYGTFIHSFTDDIGTATHYLPWNSSAETQGNDYSSTSFVVPMNMVLVKLYIRIETISNSGSFNLTVSVVSKPDGSITNTTVGTAVKSVSVNGKNYVYSEADFDSSPQLTKGQMGSIKFQASGDMGNSTDFFVTSVWRMDNNTI